MSVHVYNTFHIKVVAYFLTENYQEWSLTVIGILEILISLFLLPGLKDNTRINFT